MLLTGIWGERVSDLAERYQGVLEQLQQQLQQHLQREQEASVRIQ